MKKKLIVVDGNSIVNRAYYGVRMLNASDGLCTNAIYGTVSILLRHIENLSPDYAAIAFDLHAPTFRHKMYDLYKATRKGMPEELAVQMPYVKECVKAMGFRILEKEGYEADDILGTLSDFADENTEVYLITGDRDSLQLIKDGVCVLLATNKDTVLFDYEHFVSEYGITPEQFVDTKALMGDSSDNIPGVAGIGQKTALSLIAKYNSLDGVYESLEEKELTQSTVKKLSEGKESAYLSRRLAEIVKNVPLDISLEDLTYNGFDNATLYKLFKRFEFNAFIKRMGLDKAKSDVASASPQNQIEYAEKEITAKELFLLDKNVPLAFCIESCISFCCGETIYKYNGEYADIADFIADTDRKFICYDCKKMYEDLYKNGIGFQNCFFDVMLGAYVIKPNLNSYLLDDLALKYLSFNGDMPSVIKIYKLYEVLSDEIEKVGGKQIMFDIEMPLAKVLADMEITGFKIDRAGMEKFGKHLKELETEYAERIYFFAGCDFNINSPKQLGEILFEKLGLPSGKKTKTGYSTNVDVLKELRPYHPIISDVLDYRQVAKLRSTYADGLTKSAGEDDRIHTYFKQTGTATGRLSSAEPNLQNIPIRTELGREMRKYFISENENYVLIDADYSQIELRLLAHISNDENMINAFLEGKDIHASTASAVFGVSLDEVTTELRKRAKAVNFGIVYGIGAFSLADDLGISRVQAKKYIDSYLASYPQVSAYLKNTISEAYEKGYASTVFGRRRYIPELSSQNKNIKKFGERVAMNSPIQGSAADIIKLAMINVQKRLEEEKIDARLILQVHDELIVEANKNCAEKARDILKYEMENTVKLSVPLDVDISTAENWFGN